MVDVVDLSDRVVEPMTTSVSRRPARDSWAGTQKGGFYRRHGKRILDLILVGLSLVVVVPLVALLAGLIALDGGSPIYRQVRIGQDGRKFNLLKLRTMIPDAEEALPRILGENPELAKEWEETQKLRVDPRVTRLGRILRASSLDELPQFFNVLFGTMSLVGPRPMMPSQECMYKGAVYCDLRPGVTGLWQVSARNAESFSSRVDYDRAYDSQLSFSTDVRLLLRTVVVVMRGTGC